MSAIDRDRLLHEVEDAVGKAGVCDVHEHLLGRAQRQTRDPDLVSWLGSSYLWADLIAAGMDPAPISDSTLDHKRRLVALMDTLSLVKHTGYMEACLHAWRDLCGLEGTHLDVENLLRVDAAIREHNRDPSFSEAVLVDRCNMKHVFVDYQVGGTAVHFFGQREVFDWYDYLRNVRPTKSDEFIAEHTVVRMLDLECLHPVLKIDSLFYGWLPETAHENLQLLGIDVGARRTLDAYGALIDEAIRRAADQGAVGLKNAHNCCRSPVLGRVDSSCAEAALRTPPRKLTRENIIAFENFVFREVVAGAARYGLPLQIHTGTTYGSGGLSSAMAGGAHLLADMIQQHPDTTFLLMHGNWPHWGELEQMAKRYPNLFVDLAWSIMLSPAEAGRMLQSMFTTVPSNKLLWGGDCYYVEESYGALVQAKRVVTAALASLIDDSRLGKDDAIGLAVQLFCANGPNVYRLGQGL